MSRLIAFLPGGGLRKLFAGNDRAFGAVPRRATRVEVAGEGRHAGLFYVDMSPLSDEHQFCLLPLFADYEEAVRAEQNWLEQHWVQPKPW